jgi:hypothetical protein
MPDFEYYRVYLQAGIQEAERYLLSNQLFWPLNISAPEGEPGYPNLTLGSLLFHGACAQPLVETSSQETALRQIQTEIDHVRSHWQVAWRGKADWEFKSRLRQWGNVLKEIRVDPEDNIPYYQYEVRLRVFLDLLQAEIKEIEPADREHLKSLDLLLGALFIHGDFIWEQTLADGFPADQFWYLWGTLKEP